MSNTHDLAAPACDECGAPRTDGRTCQDYFQQMLFWENEDPARGVVHHLMVLCYYLQHPSLYSAAGLAHGRKLLADFVVHGKSAEEVRRASRERVDSGNRQWSVTARPDDQGAYERPVAWRMTAADVVAGGPEVYVRNVRVWSESVMASIAGE